MLKIFVSKKFLDEKKYILEVFLKWILNINYEIFFHESDSYTIELSNGNKIIINDSFFNELMEDQNYIKKDHLPAKIAILNNKYQIDKDLPIIYGNEKIEICEEGGQTSITIGSDIFGSGFFLLTRMEEYIKDSIDEHERFIGKDSVSYINNFLHRPIVNEYAEMLWNILLDLRIDPKSRWFGEYEIIPTHDIDTVYYDFRWINFFGDIVLDQNLKRAVKRFRLERKNHWDRFSWLMDISESNNLKSIFYFMVDSNHKLDNDYSINDNFIKTKIDEIKQRGHLIGFHPGYETMRDSEKFSEQKKLLEQATGNQIAETRQHYLRLKIPNTYSILEKNEIQIDSSLMFPDRIGFRCGTSSVFPLFDLQKRKQLNVKERPLIIMDTLLRDRKNSERSALESVSIVESYKDICKKYKIPLTILFHNNSFDPIRWDGWPEVYENYFK